MKYSEPQKLGDQLSELLHEYCELSDDNIPSFTGQVKSEIAADIPSLKPLILLIKAHW